MNQWEYKTLDINDDMASEVRNDLLRVEGAAGWELVIAILVPATERVHLTRRVAFVRYTFKRSTTKHG